MFCACACEFEACESQIHRRIPTPGPSISITMNISSATEAILTDPCYTTRTFPVAQFPRIGRWVTHNTDSSPQYQLQTIRLSFYPKQAQQHIWIKCQRARPPKSFGPHPSNRARASSEDLGPRDLTLAAIERLRAVVRAGSVRPRE
jgi:hypothetical protein